MQLKRIEAEKAKKRQRAHGNTAPGKPKSLQVNSPEVISSPQPRQTSIVQLPPKPKPSPQSRDLAAKQVGMGSQAAEKATKVVKKVDELKEVGKEKEASTLKPLAGLGEDLESIKRICRDDVAALDAIDRVTVNPKHIHIDNADNDNGIIKQSEQGNTSQYALRRLRKSRPDLHEQVLDGKLSPHKAMVEAGFRKQTFTVR